MENVMPVLSFTPARQDRAEEPSIRDALADLATLANKLLDALVAASCTCGADGTTRDASSVVVARDLSWVRPFAMLTAELDHTLRFRGGDGTDAAFGLCLEISAFLDGSSCPRSFADGYRQVRARVREIALLELQATRACCKVWQAGRRLGRRAPAAGVASTGAFDAIAPA
jgi:hypothetical protein